MIFSSNTLAVIPCLTMEQNDRCLIPIPNNGRMDSTSVTQTIDSGSIPCRVKPKIIETSIYSCLTFSIKINVEKPPPCLVDRWADGGLTRRPTVPLDVFWSRQLR